jgi:excisionase family DNA binding protein
MNTSSTTTAPEASVGSPILEYVTIAEAADWIDAGMYQIREFAHAGKVRAVRYGKLTLVSIDDVEAYGPELRAMKLASAEALSVLEAPLQVINAASGSSHTLESLAGACGVELEEATRADVSRMAQHIGGVLMAGRS